MDPAQLQPGHRLDRYELLCPLAYGGMASVWLARFGGRKGFERLVVVKMILPQYSQDPRFQEMFLDEARIASRIEHANVARILDVGEHEESTFIVMEWVDGDSLSKVVRAAEQKKQRIPAGIALRVCADAAAGLHAAHVLQERDGTHLGVVHRDVSPQNILISNAGSTVIIDFGVAKARDRVSQDTSAGQLKGKIRYMAPEQALGRAVDHRADVWALGAILYELFAGVAPYDGANEVATLHKLTSGQGYAPLPSEVPDAVCDVIDRALAYDPEGRFETALDLNLALESALLAIGEPTTTAVVAQYTGVLLTERKSARKRAVDNALASARARDADRSSSLPVASGSAPGLPLPRPQSPQSTTARLAVPPVPISAPSISERGERTSSPSGPLGVGGLSETPSATSNATLGSAAMEYPPHLVEEPARRRRFVVAAMLGVSVAVGLVGAILIIMTMSKSRSALPTSGTPHLAAPAETVDPSTLGVGTTPAPSADPPAATATTSAAPATPPTAIVPPPSTQVVAPATPPVTSTPPVATTPTVAAAPASPPAHRPTIPAAATPKPPTRPLTAPATTTKPDRGF
jgi:serine/threonine-protein kinase